MKYRLPFAAWLKHGRSSEMVIENIKDAITLTDNQQAKWQLSKFLKDLMKHLVGGKQRSRDESGDYLDYRKSLASGNILEWALRRIDNAEEEIASTIQLTKTEEFIEDLTALVASHDKDVVTVSEIC